MTRYRLTNIEIMNGRTILMARGHGRLKKVVGRWGGGVVGWYGVGVVGR